MKPTLNNKTKKGGKKQQYPEGGQKQLPQKKFQTDSRKMDTLDD